MATWIRTSFFLRLCCSAKLSWINFARYDMVRFLRLFQHVVKRNRTFTRRKRIIPPTFPPYKDARRGHNGSVPSRTLAHHLFHGKTSFLLLSIDAYAWRQVMKARLSLYATHTLFMMQPYNILVTRRHISDKFLRSAVLCL